jgi:hypothetical protein
MSRRALNHDHQKALDLVRAADWRARTAPARAESAFVRERCRVEAIVLLALARGADPIAAVQSEGIDPNQHARFIARLTQSSEAT